MRPLHRYTITMIIDKETLIKHYKKCCRSNLKRDAKICKTCPFVEYIKETVKEIK